MKAYPGEEEMTVVHFIERSRGYNTHPLHRS